MAEKQLHPERMKFAPTMRNLHHATIEAGTNPDALNEPGYWAHHASMMHQGDLIEALEESMAWYAEFLVLSVGKVSAEVYRKAYHDLGGNVTVPYDEGDDTDCTVEWAGPYHKWRVRRGEEVLQTNFQSRSVANRWVADYMQARTR